MVSTFPACDESRTIALQVISNNVERYVMTLIILSHILTFMNELMYNPPCYHKPIVFDF